MNTKPFIILITLAGAALLAGCSTIGGGHGPSIGATLPAVTPPPPPTAGAIYQAGNSIAFFQDPKAHRIGDILTVVLQEQTQAKASSSTSTGKKDNIKVGVPTLFGHSLTHVNAAASSENGFDGSGGSSQSNKLTGQITVRVVQRMTNGLLKIAGTKQLQINQSDEILTLTGYVAERDISADNTVPSGRVAMAQIHYHGRGTLSDANRMGWLARFFNSPLWPF